MGRTIPSFRIASQMEYVEWKSIRRALPKADRKLFDDMFSLSVLYNSSCVCCANPIRIRPIIMSILFHHYKELNKLTEKLKTSDGCNSDGSSNQQQEDNPITNPVSSITNGDGPSFSQDSKTNKTSNIEEPITCWDNSRVKEMSDCPQTPNNYEPPLAAAVTGNEKGGKMTGLGEWYKP